MDPPSTLSKDKQQPDKRSRRQNRNKNNNKISSTCLICKLSFLCSKNYKGQKVCHQYCIVIYKMLLHDNTGYSLHLHIISLTIYDVLSAYDISYNYIPYYQFACWDCRMSSAALELGYTCPITNTIMFSPTTASDGQCYERHAIQVWIATGEC